MRRARTFFPCLLVLALVSAAQADDRRLLDYVVIAPPNAVFTIAYGINAAGHVVGFYVAADGAERGFLLRGGEYTDIEYPGADWTEARGIGPGGEIVGIYGDGDRMRGFLRDRRGEYLAIDFPGATNTMPVHITPAGKIIGCFHEENFNTTMFGFELDASGYLPFHLHSTMHNSATPDGTVIVGLRQAPGVPQEGYIWEGGVYTAFAVPASTATAAWDVNARGEIVGVYRLGVPPSATFRGFIRSPEGEFSTVHVPGATQTRAFGINAGGDVVGFAVLGGVTRGFLLSRSQRLNPPGLQ